ncbi:hypothetical protein K466DRAFT_636333, partial [Polyporus arcularius HHB13444]
AVFFCWEYCITFNDEVELFWKRGFSGATALFLVNRYVVLTVNILNLIGYATLSDQSDFRFDLVGVNIPLLGCTATTTVSTELFKKFSHNADVIIDRTCLIAADLILIYVTWYTLGRKAFSNSHHSFVGVLLQDGTIYFMVLLLLNILHLVFTMLAIDTPLQGASNVSSFTEPVTATLVSRFLIHLQAANRRTLHIDTDNYAHHGATVPSLGTLVFDRVVGPMESTLSHGGADDSSEGRTSDETQVMELRPTTEDPQNPDTAKEPTVDRAV